ncbi:MAG: glycosyltransferase [Desulfobacterales bacterium]
MVSIIIPTLNEAGNIDPLLKRIFKAGRSPTAETEVVFVDDDSTDGTRERIRFWQAAHPVRLIHRKGKNGLAAAVVEGARVAVGEIVVVMDADLSHPPEAIPQLVAPLQRDRCDMTVGSR